MRTEVAWATLHGLATLRIHERLPTSSAVARLHLAHRMLTEFPANNVP